MSHPYVPMPLLLRGDARALPLPANSVDLVVTSPPYFGLRDYGHPGQLGAEATPGEFLDALIGCTAEMMRVLKPCGSIWVNLGDKYAGTGGHNNGSYVPHDRRAPSVYSVASRARDFAPGKSLMLLPHRYAIRCMDELGLIVRQDQVWSKVNGLPESVTDRTRRSHEYFFHMVKSPRYFAAVDHIREPHIKHDAPRPVGSRNKTPRHANAADYSGWKDHQVSHHPLGKLPGSVWRIATQPLAVPASLGVDHFAAFPMEWPRRLILGWCPPAGIVLDPFAGTNTTALVATMLGRRGVGVELSPDYHRIAKWRASDAKERARAAGLDPERVAVIRRQSTGQVDMFDLFEDEAPA